MKVNTINLLKKQLFKMRYRFFYTLMAVLGFMIVFYYVSLNGLFEEQPLIAHSAMFGLIILFSASAPYVLFPNLYDLTNATHESTIPASRKQRFLSGYLLGLEIGLVLTLVYTISTVLIKEGVTIWLNIATGELLVFLLYYHMALMCFMLAGTIRYYIVLLGFCIFAPFMLFMAASSVATIYIRGFSLVNYESIIQYVFPIYHYILALVEPKWVTVNIDGAMVVLSILLLVITYLLYTKRPLERTYENIVYPGLEKWIRYFIVYITSLVCLSGVFMITDLDPVSSIVSYVIMTFMIVICESVLSTRKLAIFRNIAVSLLIMVMCAGTSYLSSKLVGKHISSNIQGITLVDSTNVPVTYEKDSDIKQLLVDLNNTIFDETEEAHEMSIELNFRYKTALGLEVMRSYYVTSEDFTKYVLPVFEAHPELYNHYFALEQHLMTYLREPWDVSCEVHLKDVIDEQNYANYHANDSYSYYTLSHTIEGCIEQIKYNPEWYKTENLEHSFIVVQKIKNNRTDSYEYSYDTTSPVMTYAIQSAVGAARH